MSKTSISSIVCFDIIDFSKKSAAEKKAALAQFKKLLALAIVDIPEQDLQVVETGHGAIVTCKGVLESALEDALFIALTVRDEALGRNAEGEEPLYLLIGINLGSVKSLQSQNVNDAPTIEGEGLVEAQRIMSFANPNQILVSRAYHEMASKLTLEIAQMFEKYDMHAYEHDIYAVRMLSEKPVEADTASQPVTADAVASEASASEQVSSNWQVYFLPILLGLIMLFVLIKWFNAADESPTSPTQTIELPDLPEQDSMTIDTTESDDTIEEVVIDAEAPPEETDTANTMPVKKKVSVKPKRQSKTTPSAKQAEEANVETTQAIESTETQNYDSVVVPVEEDDVVDNDDKSTWQKFKDSIKQGGETECTQAQRVMNQCN